LVDAILSEFFVSKMPSFGAVWETFATHIREAFLLDSRAVDAPALRCLEPAYGARCCAVGRGGTSALVGGELGVDAAQV
jgi:hypothetical protein